MALKFFQVLTHLCLVLLHLVFISMNLPQQIFNSLVTKLVPFAIGLIQLSHLSYQKRGDLGREEGRQELNQAEMRMPFENLKIILWSSLNGQNTHLLWKQVVLKLSQKFCLQTFNSSEISKTIPSLIPALGRTRHCYNISQNTRATYCPEQILVMDHHPHNVSRPLCQLLLLPLGDLVWKPLVHEEVWGHDCGDVPEVHFVVVLPGNHFAEKFKQSLKREEEA